jgi:hypothetical protein
MKTTKVDDRHRIRIPDLKPGQVFAWEDNGKGQITLLEVQPKAKEVHKTTILDGLIPPTKAECEECWGPKRTGTRTIGSRRPCPNLKGGRTSSAQSTGLMAGFKTLSRSAFA